MGAGESVQSKINPIQSSMLSLKKRREQQNQYTGMLFNNLIDQIAKRPKIQSVAYQEFEEFFLKSDGDIQKFFQLVQERISDIYISLSRKTLQLMTEKKLTSTESKILISQQILSTSINILKSIGNNTNFKYIQKNVERLNNLQVSILGYMKVKYPRQSQNFVPGQIMQILKSFDYLQQPQNDILKILKIHFGSEDQSVLNRKVKKFLNAIITECDQKFPIFQQLMLQKVLVVTKQGVRYTVRHKVSRKIPQNVEKFPQNDSNIDLKSPQVFRLIYKWVKDMEDYLLNPEQQIKQKDHFKTINQGNKQIEIDFVSIDQIDQNLYYLRQALGLEKGQYIKQIQQLKKHLQLFNHNLIRALSKTQREQKYVPKRQAQVIKYSMFNRKLLSWMLVQRLMIVLKKLIKVSKNFQPYIGVKLDFIKCNVTDTMRAQVTGNKFQIIKVFNNLRDLQNLDELKIVRIKNRLQTPLNDCMIIFKITKSFLFCELQLILSDGYQSESDKLKSIQVLNHFFYQIERSPYGVMSELSSLLSSKDNKVNYQQAISFQKVAQLNMDDCELSHPQKILKQYSQKNPFICSLCTQFYGEYENIFIYKYCQQCNLYLCAKCIFTQGKQSEIRMRKQALLALIKHQLDRITEQAQTSTPQANNASQMTSNAKNIGMIQSFFDVKISTSLRQIKKKGNKISYRQLQRYIKSKKQFSQILEQNKTMYFSVCKFLYGRLVVNSMKINKINGVKQSFKLIYDNPVEQIIFNYFDFMIVHHKATIKNVNQISTQANIKIFHNFNVPKIKVESKNYTINVNELQLKNSNNQKLNLKVMVDIEILPVKSNEQKQMYNVIEKKQFGYSSIQAMRSNLPDLLQVRQLYQLGNEGVEDSHLSYFQTISWKKDVRIMNLHNNKITDISMLIKDLPNLQKIIVSKNYIKKIQFKFKLPNLKKFIAFQNSIQQFSGIQNISNITDLNLMSNCLTQFPFNKVVMPNMRILNLSGNQLGRVCSLSQKSHPRLVNLMLQGDATQSSDGQKTLQFDLPYLLILQLRSVNIDSINISTCENLQNLWLECIITNQIKFPNPKRIKKVNIINLQRPYEQTNEVSNQKSSKYLQQFLQNQFPQITTLNLQQVPQSNKLKLLKMPKLKQLFLIRMQIDGLQNFQRSQLPLLQSLELTQVQIDSLPVLKLPSVKYIHITYCGIYDAKNLEKWDIPKIQVLNLSSFNTQTQVPFIENIRANEIYISGGKLKQDITVYSSSLKQMTIVTSTCNNFPILKIQNLLKITLLDCEINNLSIFSMFQLPKLQFFQVRNLQTTLQQTALPVLNFPAILELTFGNCRLTQALNISISKMPKLKKLDLSQNQIKKMGSLRFQSLQQLCLRCNQLSEIKWLQQSILQNLSVLELSTNKFNQFPILNMPKLTVLQLNQCQIKTLRNMSLCKLPELKTLDIIGGNNLIQQYPIMKLPKIQNIQMNNQQLKDISFLQKCQLGFLKQINIAKAKLNTPKLPKLKLPFLQNLILAESNIQDISSLQHSQLPKITSLQLSKTSIKILPKMSFGLLKEIYCINNADLKKIGNCLLSIDKFANSNLPALTLINFSYNLIQELPKLNFPELSQIYIQDNQIKDLSQFIKSDLPSLKILHIFDNPINMIPWSKKLNPLKLYMRKAAVQNFQTLYDLSSVVTEFYYNDSIFAQNLPTMHFKNVQILSLTMCQIKEIDNFVKNPMFQIKQLALTDNQIERVPKIVAPKLKKLYLNRNCIKFVQQFVKSQLPSIEMLSVQGNQIQNLVDFPFENVKDPYFSSNKIVDLSFMSKYKYPNMTLIVASDNKVTKLGKLNAPVLKSIYFHTNLINSLQPLQGSQLSNLVQLQLQGNKIKDLSPLNKIKFDSLQKFFCMNNCITKLCKITSMPLISSFYVSQNPIQNLDEFLSVQTNIYYFKYSLNLKQPAKQALKLKVKNAYPNRQPIYQEFIVQS